MRRLLKERAAQRRDVIIGEVNLSEDWLRTHHFTTDARHVIETVLGRAAARGMLGRLPVALLLWSLLRWERKVGLSTLEACNVDLQALEKDVAERLRDYSGPCDSRQVDCAQISEIAAWAAEEAKGLGHRYVGTEHLVL